MDPHLLLILGVSSYVARTVKAVKCDGNSSGAARSYNTGMCIGCRLTELIINWQSSQVAKTAMSEIPTPSCFPVPSTPSRAGLNRSAALFQCHTIPLALSHFSLPLSYPSPHSPSRLRTPVKTS